MTSGRRDGEMSGGERLSVIFGKIRRIQRITSNQAEDGTNQQFRRDARQRVGEFFLNIAY